MSFNYLFYSKVYYRVSLNKQLQDKYDFEILEKNLVDNYKIPMIVKEKNTDKNICWVNFIDAKETSQERIIYNLVLKKQIENYGKLKPIDI